jgi:lysine decarboxylase
MLHLGRGGFVDQLELIVNRAFRSMQSTSSSSLLMASLDVARSALAVHGTERIQRSLDAAAALRAGIRAAGRFSDLTGRFLASPGVVSIDPLRVVVDTRSGGISGHAARQLLFHEHRVHTEMATDRAVVAVIGAGAVPDVARVLAAFAALPDRGAADSSAITLPPAGSAVVSLREAYFAAAEVVRSVDAVGRISADSLAAYPPGIPHVLPGEVLTDEVVEFLRRTAASPFGHVRGALDRELSRMRVLAQV